MSRRLETLGTLSLNSNTANVTTTANSITYTWDNIDWVTVFANRTKATDVLYCEHLFEGHKIRWAGNSTFSNRLTNGSYQSYIITSNMTTRSAVSGNPGQFLNIGQQQVSDISVWRPPNSNSLIYFIHEKLITRRRALVIPVPRTSTVSITFTASQSLGAAGVGPNDNICAGVHSFSFYILRN